MATTFRYTLDKLIRVFKLRTEETKGRNWLTDAILALGRIYVYLEYVERAEGTTQPSAHILMDKLYKELLKIHRTTEIKDEPNFKREITLNEYGHVQENTKKLSAKKWSDLANRGEGEIEAELIQKKKRRGRPISNRHRRTKRYPKKD